MIPSAGIVFGLISTSPSQEAGSPLGDKTGEISRLSLHSHSSSTDAVYDGEGSAGGTGEVKLTVNLMTL